MSLDTGLMRKSMVASGPPWQRCRVPASAAGTIVSRARHRRVAGQHCAGDAEGSHRAAGTILGRARRRRVAGQRCAGDAEGSRRAGLLRLGRSRRVAAVWPRLLAALRRRWHRLHRCRRSGAQAPSDAAGGAGPGTGRHGHRLVDLSDPLHPGLYGRLHRAGKARRQACATWFANGGTRHGKVGPPARAAPWPTRLPHSKQAIGGSRPINNREHLLEADGPIEELRLFVRLSHRIDQEIAAGLAVQAMAATRETLGTPAPVCLSRSATDGSAVLELHFHVRDLRRGRQHVLDEARSNIWDALNDHRIAFTFPAYDRDGPTLPWREVRAVGQ